MNKIFHFKLMNQEEIIGRLFETDEDKGTLQIEYPMLVGERITDGVSQVVLHKYLQFSDSNIAHIRTSDVLCISVVTDSFARYYDNSIVFNSIYIDKAVEKSIKQTNDAIEDILNETSQSFEGALRTHNVDPSTYDLTTKH